MGGDRLDKGFVTWQGRRVFVPWFGAPRIVPTAPDEVRVVKLKFRMDTGIAMAAIPFGALSIWLGTPWGFAFAVLGVVLVLAASVLAQRRHVGEWPPLMTASFARHRFMLGYFRSLRFMERVNALGWAGLGIYFSLTLLVPAILALLKTSGDGWLMARLAALSLGPGLWAFLAGRHAMLALLSLLPLKGAGRSSCANVIAS
jgi:hypothetical protein